MASADDDPLVPFINALDKIAPAVDLDGDQITILDTPHKFYETLKGRIRHAQQRIFLSTLYIGKEETELIFAIKEALHTWPSLKVYVLTDMLRGTREAPEACSASLLAPLVAEFGDDRVQIRMYHTPKLTGLKKHLPKRINEGWGLQHMKLYGMDDELIMSGANLSHDYFSNRQDRYHMFRSKEMTDHFFKLHQAVSSFSYVIRPSDDPAGFEASWPATTPNPLDDPQGFVSHASRSLDTLARPRSPLPCLGPNNNNQNNTRVYLLMQMSPILPPDSSTELPALSAVLDTLALSRYHTGSWMFTAGYFNPAPALTQKLLRTCVAVGAVVTAHPAANGFYQSKGLSRMLPDAYTHLARRFLRAVDNVKRSSFLFASASQASPSKVMLREWRRGTVNVDGGWSYHAKGFWATMSNPDDGPSLTLVGSSNYTKRSYSLDLEAGALVLTRDRELKQRLRQEQDWLLQHTTAVTADELARGERRTGITVRLAMWLVNILGGAL